MSGAHETLGDKGPLLLSSDALQQVLWRNQEPPAFDAGECQITIHDYQSTKGKQGAYG